MVLIAKQPTKSLYNKEYLERFGLSVGGAQRALGALHARGRPAKLVLTLPAPSTTDRPTSLSGIVENRTETVYYIHACLMRQPSLLIISR